MESMNIRNSEFFRSLAVSGDLGFKNPFKVFSVCPKSDRNLCKFRNIAAIETPPSPSPPIAIDHMATTFGKTAYD